MEKLKFNPEDGFLNSAEYPDPENETEAREQLFIVCISRRKSLSII